MSKKNKEEEEEGPLLGRVGTNLKVGIVGLPNVGKSSLFNVLTNSNAKAENFPFCTIDPNTARCNVPDIRFDWLCEHWKPESKQAAILNITDIAGLVKGASKGEGLGNAFLSHIRETDAIFHILRIFEDSEITHVDGDIDPVRDEETITNELLLKDLDFMKTQLTKLEKKRDGSNKLEIEFCKGVIEYLEAGKEIRLKKDWKSREVEYLNEYQLLTAKPVVYLINMSPTDYFKQKNKWLTKILNHLEKKEKKPKIIPFSANFESIYASMKDEEKKKYLEENKTKSQINNMIKTGYKSLDLIYYFTAGEDEVKAWTIKKGTKAPEAGGKIHSDFETGFINCEIMAFKDYKEFGSENELKDKGLLKQQGKNYVVQDGDIIYFKTTLRKSKKK